MGCYFAFYPMSAWFLLWDCSRRAWFLQWWDYSRRACSYNGGTPKVAAQWTWMLSKCRLLSSLQCHSELPDTILSFPFFFLNLLLTAMLMQICSLTEFIVHGRG